MTTAIARETQDKGWAARCSKPRPSFLTLHPSSRCLEGAECLVVLTLYAGLVARLFNHWDETGFVNLLLVPSEGLVIFFMLVRRRTEEMSQRLGDWTLAFGALCCPLLVVPAVDQALLPPAVAASILLM